MPTSSWQLATNGIAVFSGHCLHSLIYPHLTAMVFPCKNAEATGNMKAFYTLVSRLVSFLLTPVNIGAHRWYKALSRNLRAGSQSGGNCLSRPVLWILTTGTEDLGEQYVWERVLTTKVGLQTSQGSVSRHAPVTHLNKCAI